MTKDKSAIKDFVDPSLADEPKIVGELDRQQSKDMREIQVARSRVMGVVLLGLCALFFAITIVKVGVWG